MAATKSILIFNCSKAIVNNLLTGLVLEDVGNGTGRTDVIGVNLSLKIYPTAVLPPYKEGNDISGSLPL
ncbi:MAG: hypothetical protein V7K38_04445 [Nostoc sp.]|uniref:hypothetical protein n=1 Tax=Nostoc sp. TaxID=1180 RepID=UPI002FF5DFB1